jgi:hypothetical protein
MYSILLLAFYQQGLAGRNEQNRTHVAFTQ